MELLENNIKTLLISEGFFEVINDPFVNHETNNSIKLDNPLDSRRKNLRINIEKSLIDNLLYNERRQQDSIKLFEITDVYYLEKKQLKNKKWIVWRSWLNSKEHWLEDKNEFVSCKGASALVISKIVVVDLI